MKLLHPRTGALFLYQGIFWTLLLLPFDFQLPRSLTAVLSAQILHFEEAPEALGIEILKSLTHALMFFPFAPVLAWGRREPLRRIFHYKLLLFIVLLSAFSEIVQLTVGRGASLPDFLMDLCGFLLGLLAVRLHRRIEILQVILRRLTSAWVAAAGILLMTALIWIAVSPAERLPFGPRGLENWDPTLPLNLGSERTRSRPWAGVIETLSVNADEDQALEVLRYELTPPNVDLDTGGSVTGLHGKGPVLEARAGSRARLVQNGVELLPTTLLTTRFAPQEAIESIRKSGFFSIAVRIRPQELYQYGPARIVTCSATNRIRNFTLSQEANGLDFRVRTPLTGSDALMGGILRVPNCLQANTTVDIKASYSAGTLRLWIDGQLRGARPVSYLDWLSHRGFGSPFNRRVQVGLATTAWGVFSALFWLLLVRLGSSQRRAQPLALASAGLWIVATLALAWPAPAWAEDWPSWRGASGVGISQERNIATRWSPTENIRWTFDDPGLGHSSPIVWKSSLFLTTSVNDSRLLLKLDVATGREAWRREVLKSDLERKHQKNSHASSTPATDGERVYVTFLDQKRVVAAAYDFYGKEVWRVSPGEFHSMHGFCSSPLLFEDLVILNCDQDADAYLVALHNKSGKERWRVDRTNKVRSYCPPTVFSIEGKPQMILSGSETVCSYEPGTGKRLWICTGPTEQCVASLVYGDGLVFVTGGFPDREFLAIDPRGTGDVTESHIRWRANKQVSYVPSPLYLDGHFYCVSDTGVLSSLVARTGEYKTTKRLRGNFSASLLYADGHIYAASEEGEVFVLKAEPTLQTVSEISMNDPIYASPVVADGILYLRTWKKLHAVSKSLPVKSEGLPK